MKLKVYGGQTPGQVEVTPEISEAKPNEGLIAQVVRAHLNNLRQSNAHSKNRGEVSGGGKKPFRQKGTGRARAGSTRSPLWIGGGVTFGPRNERNYVARLPKKMAAAAIRMAMAAKIKDQKFIVTKSLEFPEIGTRKMQAYLEKLPIEEGRILIVLAKTNANLELSASNLSYLKTVQIDGMKLIDILKYDYLLTDLDGLKAIEKRYGNPSTSLRAREASKKLKAKTAEKDN